MFVKWAILEIFKNVNSSATLLIYQNYEKTHESLKKAFENINDNYCNRASAVFPIYLEDGTAQSLNIKDLILDTNFYIYS